MTSAYQESWRWHPKEEKIVHDRCLGSVLHVCSGKSPLNGVSVDLYTKSDVKADALNLPFRDRAFDTVVSDPPWNLGFIPRYWKELKRVANKRILFIGLSAMKPGKGWGKPKYQVLANRQGFQLKVLVEYNRVGDMTPYLTNDTK